MSTKTKKLDGHKHDIEPTEITNGHVRAYQILNNEKVRPSDEPPVKHLTGSHVSYKVGTNGDDIILVSCTQGIGYADIETVIEGRLEIERAENLIRGLVTVVKQAKKNRIDKPGLGNPYPPFDLKENEDEAERYTLEGTADVGYEIYDGGAPMETPEMFSDYDEAQARVDQLNATA